MFPGMPGMPGGPGAFDFSSLQAALNVSLWLAGLLAGLICSLPRRISTCHRLFVRRTSQDPAIKEMAEKIANDDSFKAITQQLQSQFGGVMGGAAGAEGASRSAPAIDPASFDPSKMMGAMSGMFQNPQFMQMAEKLGKTIIEASA
jgi:hypothetical protein